MRWGYISIIAFALVLISVASAASDNEIQIFAKGVLSSDYEKYSANILGNNLSIEGSFNQYEPVNVENIGSRLSRMSGLAKKIIDAYPDRYKRLDLKIYDSMGKNLLGTMSIVVGNGSLTWT